MIDLALLRDETERVVALIKKKDPSFDTATLVSLDGQVRKIKAEVEAVRSKKNELAKQGQYGVTPELRMQSKELSELLEHKEQELQEVSGKFRELYLYCPNLLLDDVPAGNKEQNQVVKTWGTKPAFLFPSKNHVELGAHNKWFDFEAAARMTGTNFALYTGQAVHVVYALMMYMWQHAVKNGYTPFLPPYLVTEKSLECASNFPRFKDQVYELPADRLYLTPTAEVNLTNYYREHTFSVEELPVRMTAWTSCFRREAGTYGAHERGLIRIHQFEKVELYTICEPERAVAEQERMLACAEDILQKLGLHYQVSLLAAQDCSFASGKTYDIEVWMPGQGTYKEVSSCSNCTDFQARRSDIRYRVKPGAKTQLAYTLNSSALALPRLMVALMETYQQPDGSIKLPDVLKNISCGI
jgi:seryl-tRNA synthetase